MQTRYYLNVSTCCVCLAVLHALSVRPRSICYYLRLSIPTQLFLLSIRLSNYRPVSNLSFISKLTEHIVLSRINDYLTSNSLLNPHQSGFTKRHSTETLLTSLYNKLVSAISHQQVSCFCLLDISAAFDRNRAFPRQNYLATISTKN